MPDIKPTDQQTEWFVKAKVIGGHVFDEPIWSENARPEDKHLFFKCRRCEQEYCWHCMGGGQPSRCNP